MNIFEIEAALPGGFHDALLHSYTVDLASGVAHLRMEICVGDPTSPDYAGREARRFGVLTLSGLDYFAVDLPGTSDLKRVPQVIDLCSEIENRSSHTAVGTFSARFFSSSANGFIHLKAESAHFAFD